MSLRGIAIALNVAIGAAVAWPSQLRAYEIVGSDSPKDNLDVDYTAFMSPPEPPPSPKDCKRRRYKQADYKTGSIPAFMKLCLNSGVSAKFCQELIRPNPESIDAFRCTYPGKPHELIPPQSRSVAVRNRRRTTIAERNRRKRDLR